MASRAVPESSRSEKASVSYTSSGPPPQPCSMWSPIPLPRCPHRVLRGTPHLGADPGLPSLPALRRPLCPAAVSPRVSIPVGSATPWRFRSTESLRHSPPLAPFRLPARAGSTATILMCYAPSLSSCHFFTCCTRASACSSAASVTSLRSVKHRLRVRSLTPPFSHRNFICLAIIQPTDTHANNPRCHLWSHTVNACRHRALSASGKKTNCHILTR